MHYRHEQGITKRRPANLTSSHQHTPDSTSDLCTAQAVSTHAWAASQAIVSSIRNREPGSPPSSVGYPDENAPTGRSGRFACLGGG
jgi:hypothetical protein